MRIARVFPTKTKASPDDDLAFFGEPPMLFPPEVDEVHVSVAFEWDKKRAEQLAYQWECVAPVKVGGPAYGDMDGEFEVGKYMKKGYVITSRGCPNKCWFCKVWKNVDGIHELKIQDGYALNDDNILACSRKHIKDVFAMLKRQSKPAEFIGGLEAARLEEWHINIMADMRIKQMFFAYDTPDDYEPLVRAGELLKSININQNKARCYVLIGYAKDTFEAAEKRLRDTWKAGFMPFAMLYSAHDRNTDVQWRKFQRLWARPAAIKAMVKEN